MIGLLLKLLWNRKRSYLVIFIEQALIAVILMFCVVRFMQMLQQMSDPGLLDTSHTVIYGNDFRGVEVPPTEIHQATALALHNYLKSLPCVEAMTRSADLIPFNGNHSRRTDSIPVDNRKIKANIKGSDEYGATVFRIEIQEGKWLDGNVLADGTYPAVITRQFADKAGWNNAVGKQFPARGRTYTVVGVVAGLKDDLFKPSEPAVVLPVEHFTKKDMTVVRVTDETAFIDALYKESNRLYSAYRNTLLVTSLDLLKQAQLIQSAISIILISIPALFLTVFAFIGIFGVLSLNGKRQQKEYSLRIAIGSTKLGLMGIVIGESLFITSLSLVPAFALSFVLFDYSKSYDLIGIGITVLLMLIFSVVSSFLPAWNTSRINPAEALKYE
jgi:ABC-type antimicrobial peptide transport system permease subunit